MSTMLRATSAFLVLLIPSAVSGQKISNPDLFAKSLRAAGEALEHYGRYDEPEELRRVADIGYGLVLESGFEDFPFTFHLIDMPVPNAFALPGGQIFVTRGMLALGLEDDMLACLLGHEIAHVTERHGLRMQRRATLLNVLSQVALLGVIVGAEDGPENPRDPYGYRASGSRKGELVQGTAAAGMVISELLLRDYSRDFEEQADAEGQRMAAAAGYDPEGARRLWDLMSRRIPQSREYGYWRTHPFSDQRMRAAQVRADELTILAGHSSEGLRQRTQELLLTFDGKGSDEPPVSELLEVAALTAWPRGRRAEEIRLARLHRLRDEELARHVELRDYGDLVRVYEEEIAEVRLVTPEAPFLTTLEDELAELRAGAEKSFPGAAKVWEDGVYQTEFLETFLSNYPEAPQRPQVALALGDAYSRLGRPSEAVSAYLTAAKDAEEDSGRKAVAGLRALAPRLQQLAALQELSDEIEDAELRDLARQRLAQLAGGFKELADGARYLDRYPDGEFAESVRGRLETLAHNLYGEMILYQKVGDHAQALERIQQILTHAPFTRAAEKLRDRAVVES